MVRAGILRAEISIVMAIFDPPDRRDNRASLGHIVKELRASDLRALLLSHRFGQKAIPVAEKLAEFERGYIAVRDNDLLANVKRLRNDTIAHLLRPESPTPTVQNDDVFSLQGQAERLVQILFEGLGLGEPDFIGHRDQILDRSKLFWDTYFGGMRRTGAP